MILTLEEKLYTPYNKDFKDLKLNCSLILFSYLLSRLRFKENFGDLSF